MAENELKPCQCGSAVELCRGDDDYYIYCPKCELKTFSNRVYDNITDNCDRLIDVWNKRFDGADGKNRMSEVAKMFGKNLGEEFYMRDMHGLPSKYVFTEKGLFYIDVDRCRLEKNDHYYLLKLLIGEAVIINE